MTTLLSANGDHGRPLREILINREYVTAEQWAEAERLLPANPPQALIDRGWLHPTQLARARAARAGLEFRELTEAPDPRFADLLPTGLRGAGLCVVLEVTADRVVVAVADPTSAELRDDIRAAVRPRQLDLVVVPPDRLPPPTDTADEATPATEAASQQQLLADLTAAPHIVRLLNDIIDGGISLGASDIHIADFGEGGGEARYRVDGKGRPGVRFQRRYLAGLISRIKLLARLDIAHHQTPQSGDIRWPERDPQYDIRVEVAPDVRAQHCVLRIFGHIAHQELADLGFTPDIQDELDRLCGLPYGLVLLCGPTGSGKSTTLAVMLRRIHQRFPDKLLYAVENPVENMLPGVVQTPVDDRPSTDHPSADHHRSRTFAVMLRSFLRCNPDVIMLGEIRDAETAKVAVEASLTGHLVLATLHTNTAPGAIPRLLHLGVDAHLLADTVQAVLGQRLLRRTCTRCGRPTAYDGPDLAVAKRLALPETELRGGGGECEQCYGGYRGRLAIGELMVMNSDARSRLTDQVTEQDLRVWTHTPTLLDNGIRHVRAGHTTLSEVLGATWTPDSNGQEDSPAGSAPPDTAPAA